MRSFHCLVNPLSGGGAAPAAVVPVARILRDAGARVEVTYSPGPVACAQLAREATGRGDVVVAAGGDGGTNLRGHHLRFDQRLTRKVAAPFRHLLVFEVEAGDAGLFEQPHRPLDVQGFPETRVRIAQHGTCRGLDRYLGKLDELGECQQADIGDAATGRECAARDVHGPKADSLGEPRSCVCSF